MPVEHFEVKESEAKWLSRIPAWTDYLRHLLYTAYNRPDGIYKEGSVYEPFLKDEIWKHLKVSLLLTSGEIETHCDSEELPPFCYHAVLLNDGYVARSPDRKVEPQIQKPGSIIALDIHQEHELVRDNRHGESYEGYPGWISLCFNSPYRRQRHAVIDHMNMITQLLELEFQKFELSLRVLHGVSHTG